MSAAFMILFIVSLAGQQATASETCQYSYSCSGSGTGCTFKTRTCDDKCCDDKTKGYDEICCSSSSNTVVVAGGASGGIISLIIVIGFCYYCWCRTPARVTTTVTTVVH